MSVVFESLVGYSTRAGCWTPIWNGMVAAVVGVVVVVDEIGFRMAGAVATAVVAVLFMVAFVETVERSTDGNGWCCCCCCWIVCVGYCPIDELVGLIEQFDNVLALATEWYPDAHSLFTLPGDISIWPGSIMLSFVQKSPIWSDSRLIVLHSSFSTIETFDFRLARFISTFFR